MWMKENMNSWFTLDKALSTSHFFKFYKYFLNHFSKWQMLPHSSAEDLCDFNCHGVENGSPRIWRWVSFFNAKLYLQRFGIKRLQCETDLTFTIDIFYVLPTSERHFTCAVMKHLTFKFDLTCKLVLLPSVNQSRIKPKAEEKLLYFIKGYD